MTDTFIVNSRRRIETKNNIVYHGPPFYQGASIEEALMKCYEDFDNLLEDSKTEHYEVSIECQDSNKSRVIELTINDKRTVWSSYGTLDEILRDLDEEIS